MKKKFVTLSIVVLVVLVTLVVTGPAASQPPTPPVLERLSQDAGGEVEVTWNPLTGTPSFIRARISLSAIGLDSQAKPSAVAIAFADRYARLLGIKQASSELKVMQDETDVLGMRHVTLQQVYQGVDIYGGSVKVHLSADGQEVVAVSSSFVPDIQVPDTQAHITAEQALTAARKALPNGILLSGPKLVIYPGHGERPGASAKLAWLVELRDDSIPARNVYVVDAVEGAILDVLDRIYEARNRRTYNANHGYTLPGTLARSEGQGPTGDRDIDNAHDFAGATYDYYWNTHRRDSYDNRGATLVSTVHFGRSYQNAYWNGEQTVYGDYFPVKDVVAHEWTHAVTEHSANLEYRWQSGALNESFSDIFAAMVDRDDWLIGEDLPPHILGGREAVRDLSNPPRFGQPDHTDDWVKICDDREGVHTNSGITNKAYYNIATVIGKGKAERIFYRVLTVYLHSNSGLEDARAAALQSAQDLYGANGAEYNAVRDGFNAVGLDGQWNPPPNDCPCAASVALAAEPDGQDLLSNLRAVRDQVFTQDPGRRWVNVYYEHQFEVAWLLISDAQLRADAQAGFRAFDPVFRALLTGDEASSHVVITREMVEAAERALMGVAKRGSPAVREDIIREWERINPYRFVGWDVAKVKQQLLAEEARYRIYLPLVRK
jgi:bacillolysin